MSFETEQTNKIVRHLRSKYGACVLNITGSRLQQDGWPDIRIDHRGIKAYIEFKGPKTPLQSNQKRMIKRLRANGSKVFIIRIREPNTSRLAFTIEDINGEVKRNLAATNVPEFCSELILHGGNNMWD